MVLDITSDGISGQKGKQKKNRVRLNISDVEYQIFIHIKPVLTLEYGTLFEHQGFLIQGLCRMHFFVALELPKELFTLGPTCMN